MIVYRLGFIHGRPFFESGCDWGRSIITGLARFDGRPVAIFAEDVNVYGGGWTAAPRASSI